MVEQNYGHVDAYTKLLNEGDEEGYTVYKKMIEGTPARILAGFKELVQEQNTIGLSQPGKFRVDPSVTTKLKMETWNRQTSLFDRHRIKLILIGALVVLGISLGIALTATGIFSPIGLGVLGMVYMGLVGLGAGLTVSAPLSVNIIQEERAHSLYKKNAARLAAVPALSSHAAEQLAASVPAGIPVKPVSHQQNFFPKLRKFHSFSSFGNWNDSSSDSTEKPGSNLHP